MVAKRQKRRSLLKTSTVVVFLCFFILQTFDTPQTADYYSSSSSSSSKVRTLLQPNDGSVSAVADLLWENKRGTFWLPRPPPDPLVVNGAKFMHSTHINMVLGTSFNAGDFLSLFLGPMIAGRPAVTTHPQRANQDAVVIVGSTLQWNVTYWWGPGFMTPDQTLTSVNPQIFSVRGPLSYDQLQNPSIPKVFGDIGSLISWFYQPRNKNKRYDLCLIPHYVDAEESELLTRTLEPWKNSNNHLVINIKDPLFTIMDQLVQCRFALSSTLHGIIFADSYGIPNAHIQLSQNVRGGFHKFDDYYRSINRTRISLQVSENTKSSEILQFVQTQHPSYAKPPVLDQHLWAFWKQCPIHAQAYQRTRIQHLTFAKQYAREFYELNQNRPEKQKEFLRQLSLRLEEK